MSSEKLRSKTIIVPTVVNQFYAKMNGHKIELNHTVVKQTLIVCHGPNATTQSAFTKTSS